MGPWAMLSLRKGLDLSNNVYEVNKTLTQVVNDATLPAQTISPIHKFEMAKNESLDVINLIKSTPVAFTFTLSAQKSFW